MPCDQVNVDPAIVVEGTGGTNVVNNGAPMGLLLPKSLRTKRATRTAPSTLSSPAPCSNVLKPLSGWAVYINIAFTMFGVSVGLACKSNAAAPATTGEAIEVPLRYISLPLSAEL